MNFLYILYHIFYDFLFSPHIFIYACIPFATISNFKKLQNFSLEKKRDEIITYLTIHFEIITIEDGIDNGYRVMG